MKVGFMFVVSATVLVSLGFVVCFFCVRSMIDEWKKVEKHCFSNYLTFFQGRCDCKTMSLIRFHYYFWKIAATTPNPCLEYRDVRYLSDACGNYSSTGYCVQSNSACLPFEDGSDWTCRCIHGYYNHNSSCVPGTSIPCWHVLELNFRLIISNIISIFVHVFRRNKIFLY